MLILKSPNVANIALDFQTNLKKYSAITTPEIETQRANSHPNVAATAKKMKKNVNFKKGNSILNYLQVKPVWGRAEAGQQHPPT